MISLLYWACPNVKQPGFPWVTPGGLFAVVLWLAASALFALYVGNFSSYNKTYGSLGGVSCSSPGCGSRTSSCCWAPS